MCKHEHKKCPRCSNSFECKVGDVTACQCYGLNFSPEERALIEERYTDCLCRECLTALKLPYTFFKEKFFLNADK
jgi:cysteine-rich CWC protein